MKCRWMSHEHPAVLIEEPLTLTISPQSRGEGTRQRAIHEVGFCPLLVRLKTAPVPGPRVAINAILSAGSSAYGSSDSLVVSEAVYRAAPTLTITFGNSPSNSTENAFEVETYHVRLGRVRRNGRGWKLVAFDVIELT